MQGRYSKAPEIQVNKSIEANVLPKVQHADFNRTVKLKSTYQKSYDFASGSLSKVKGVVPIKALNSQCDMSATLAAGMPSSVVSNTSTRNM